MKTILIGYGEIGKGLYEVFKSTHSISVFDPKERPIKPKGKFDIMLIAIPYSDKFVRIVKDYQEEYNPKATIVFSTVPVGTTSKLKNAVHSPIEGKHPHLAKSIRCTPRWVGGYDELVEDFFSNLEVTFVDKPEYSEFLKLQSTTKYGVNVEFARYVKSVCDKIGMDFELVKDFDSDYNDLYKRLCLPRFQRYILDAPDGPKGGHCVTSNARILNKQYPDELVKIVGEE